MDSKIISIELIGGIMRVDEFSEREVHREPTRSWRYFEMGEVEPSMKDIARKIRKKTTRVLDQGNRLGKASLEVGRPSRRATERGRRGWMRGVLEVQCKAPPREVWLRGGSREEAVCLRESSVCLNSVNFTHFKTVAPVRGGNRSKQSNRNLKLLLLKINSGKRCEDHLAMAESRSSLVILYYFLLSIIIPRYKIS